MVAPLKVGIAGLGTVGAEVVRLIETQARVLAGRSGRGIRVVAVTARSKAKKRGVDLRGVEWVKDPMALATHPGIDCFVELMGGAGDPALSAVEAALECGQVGRHRQQGAARQARPEACQGRRKARRRAEFRGSGRRRDPRHQDVTRRACRNRHQPRLRHPQRHLQLHPDADGAGGPVLRRMPQGCAAARLCRGQSVLRRRRPRHRAKTRHSRQPRFRHESCSKRGVCRRYLIHRAGRSARGRRSRLPRSSCSALPFAPPRASSSACIRPWFQNPPRSRR